MDTSHFPEENECGFVYFRDDNQLFATEEIDSESFPFSNESCVHFPLPEGPLMEKVVFSLQWFLLFILQTIKKIATYSIEK